MGLSLLMNMPLLYEPQLIASFLVSNRMSGIWIVWCSVFALASSLIFFSGLWERLPIKTENDFNLFRYSGFSARLLTWFRAVFMGVFIIPLILAQSILGFANILSQILSVSTSVAYIIIGIFLSIAALFNDIRKRIFVDAWLAIAFIGLIIWFSVGLIILSGSPVKMINNIHAAGYQTSLFPAFKDQFAWVNLFILFGVQWWSALFCDMPDMEGQKLLHAEKNKGTMQFLTGIILFMFIEVFLMLIPIYALGLNSSLTFSSGEELIAYFFNKLHGYIWFVGIGILSISFISVGANFQLWSAGMLESRFNEMTKNRASSIKFNSSIWMILITWISIFLANKHETFLSIVEYLFLISAGVGPVYILRWFWKRINAWSQLSAMIASPVYLFLYHLVDANSQSMHLFFDKIKSIWMLNNYSFELILLNCLVIPTWLLVTYLTAPVQANTTTLFFKITHTFTLHKRNWLIWVIACLGFFFVKLGWWNLLSGYFLTGVFQLICVFCIFLFLKSYFMKMGNHSTDEIQ